MKIERFAKSTPTADRVSEYLRANQRNDGFFPQEASSPIPPSGVVTTYPFIYKFFHDYSQSVNLSGTRFANATRFLKEFNNWKKKTEKHLYGKENVVSDDLAREIKDVGLDSLWLFVDEKLRGLSSSLRGANLSAADKRGVSERIVKWNTFLGIIVDAERVNMDDSDILGEPPIRRW